MFSWTKVHPMEIQIDLAPIALFVYERVDHARATIEALAKNDLAKSTHLCVFSDGPKHKKSTLRVEEVRGYLDTLPSQNWFKSVTIIKAAKNKGLANSIIKGVSKLIKEYGCVIVVEDDLVTAPDYLDFMNSALDFYKTNQTIGSVTGYSPVHSHRLPSDYKHDIYLATRNCSYGWGTWLDRWEKVDWEAKAYNQLQTSFKLRNRFNECGIDRYKRLENQMNGKIDSWSIRFGLFQFMNDLYTVYPVVSRLKNIGWDGSGTHYTNKSASLSIPFNQKIEEERVPFKLENINVDARIIQAIRDMYPRALGTKVVRTVENYWLAITSFFEY